MGLLMAAILGAAAVLTFALLLAMRFIKPGAIQVVAIVVFSLLLLPLSGLVFWVLFALTVDYGIDVRPNDVPAFRVPAEATDISFYTKYGPTRLVAQFSLSPVEFQNWMASEGRPLEPIAISETVTQLSRGEPVRREAFQVKSGYRWDDFDKSIQHDDSGTTIVFDAEHNRVYVSISIW